MKRYKITLHFREGTTIKNYTFYHDCKSIQEAYRQIAEFGQKDTVEISIIEMPTFELTDEIKESTKRIMDTCDDIEIVTEDCDHND